MDSSSQLIKNPNQTLTLDSNSPSNDEIDENKDRANIEDQLKNLLMYQNRGFLSKSRPKRRHGNPNPRTDDGVRRAEKWASIDREQLDLSSEGRICEF